MKLLAALLTALLASALPGQAQEAPKSLRAVRIHAPIRIDGRLDEEAWALAPAATGFTRQWPGFGEPSQLRTEVRVLYDDASLYIGARMHQPGGSREIVRRVHRRDQDSQGDWFGVLIDSLHDRRTATAFYVNAGGVQRDGVLSNDSSQLDSSWDGVWESQVRVDAEGWTAEIRIPLSLLRIRPGGGPQTWGINFQRGAQGYLREQAFWYLPPRSESAWVSRFPELVGLEGLTPVNRREFLPYVSLKRKFETAEVFDDRRWTAAGGLDARLALTSSSQVDLTLRPDFGQVEVDQAVLNLSTLETFFPEKRPFFLEGAEIFQTIGPQLFYSRRIGRSLSAPPLAPGQQLLDRPLAAEIGAAAKYTAHYPSGLNVGLLAAGVQPGQAELEDGAGQRFRLELSPYTSYGILRAQQMTGSNGGFLGAFLSHVREARSDGREAVVAALDGAVVSTDRSDRVEFALEHSRQGPRGNPDEGWYGRIRDLHTWPGGWTLDTRLINAGRRFDPNDAGFLQTPDNRHAEFFLQKFRDRPLGPLRDLQLSWYGAVDRDQAGHLTNAELNTQARTSFFNYWGLWGGAGVTLPAENDRELRTFFDARKKYLQVASVPFAWAGFDTAGNKPWYLKLQSNFQRFEGGISTDLTLLQIIKPASNLDFQLESSWTRDAGEPRYLDTFGDAPGPLPGQRAGTPTLGLRRLSSFNQVIRIGYAFSPKMTLQLFNQWLIASWFFRDLQHYLDDEHLAPGPPPGVAEPATAFSFRTWNLNLIGRWEFLPGSTLYVVYTHGVSSDVLLNARASLRPLTDFTDLRHLPSDDVVQMKLSWLFR